ncbi:MAG: ABC transporter substrate-binding protein, partial [Fusobacterium sp.]
MKRYLKKIFIACLVLLTLIGCDSKESELKASNNLEKKEQLVFVNYRDIRDLNPHLYAGEMYAQEMLYETLVNIGPNGYEPCLAESWNISDDGKIYTFNIRKNVKFSDGTICDANAIKANFDAILENKNRHTWLEMMHLLEGVDLIDDYT